MQINLKLDEDFARELERHKFLFGEELAELNGLSDDQLDYTNFIDNFIDKETVADASVDANANVGQKSMVVLLNEMAKPHQKLLSLNKIFYEMKKRYGLDEAAKWFNAEWTGELYMHDAHHASYLHYCWASSLKDLAEKGLFFIDNFNAEPPRHLGTFIDFVKEYISFCANSSSGATGLPDLIVYMYYFWRKDIENDYFTETPEKYAKQHIQRLIYALNQPFLRGNVQSAFTNTSIFDLPYLEALFGGMQFPDGSLVYDELDDILDFQKLFMDTLHEIREKNMMTYPVNTISLLKDADGNFVDEEFAKWACEQNMKWCDSNFFIDDSVTSLSSCCRLSNNVKDLYMNSIGGTALKVGSEKVCTINLARIAYITQDQQEYLKLLRERTELCLHVLDVVRHIIERNIEKGLMKNFETGIVEMDKLYSTIGVIGVYETMKKFGYVKKDGFGYVDYTEEGLEFAEKIFETIHEVKTEFKKDHDYMINIEAVPAETAAYKLMQKDKLFFYDEDYDLPLYANQWVPLAVRTSIRNKIDISARLDEACTGGSMCHINLDGPFTSFDTAWNLLKELAKSGVKYFAFCTKISACKHNHGFYGDICPVCGEPKVTTYQRIVGFLTPVRTYSEPRKKEFYMRDWMKVD
jgi:ribonucleoside-triphosphate reductase (formate)